MSLTLRPRVLIGLACVLASLQGVSAQDNGPLALCISDACDNCPASVTTTGTGYPACVVYDRDTVLGGDKEKFEENGEGVMVHFDIAEVTDPECRTVIRTPASTTDVNCGVPVYGGTGGTCTAIQTKDTFMVQFCCGTGDCSAAGVGKRSADGSITYTSAVLKDASDNVLLPHSVGDAEHDLMDVFYEDFGFNATTRKRRSAVPVYRVGYEEEQISKPKIAKRDCDHYTNDGDTYTKTSSESVQVSGYICDSNSAVTITNEHSVSQSTTFSSSVGDPFGIISVSIDFTFEEEASQSYTYMYTPDDNQCGHLSFTPFLLCTQGTMTGCGDVGDQTGEACTAKRIDDNQIDGAYIFVQTS